MPNANILIIDDEESIRHTFDVFLSTQGYRVMTARDYQEALQAITATPFDLIMTDILLGGESGIEVLRQVRARGLQTPVVMITGEPNIETAAASVRLGAFDYLPKPIRKETLLRVAQHALQHKTLLDEKATIQAEKERYRTHLEAIFRSVNDAIVTVDNDLRIIEANEATERICAFSPRHPDWLKGRTGCSRRCWHVLEEAMHKDRSVQEYRIECEAPGRPQQTVVITISPLKDIAGQPLGAVMAMHDITRLNDLERELKERNQFHNIIGRSQPMQAVYDLLEHLKDIDTTVLITGPSGTGKELIARALHYGGARAHKPFVVVNCSALAETLLESELFGHVKGAFTGAIRDKEGRFQLANHGTIFLDEIGDISPRIQLKLLRVLENKEIERVGDAQPLKLDVQVITATNCDLRAKINQGEFREDLYYRLKVVEISLPPLTERRDDIPLIVAHYLEAFNKRFRKDIQAIDPDVERLFLEYPWPGNIRELIHTLEHAFVVCGGRTIGMRDLPPEMKASLSVTKADRRLPTEREQILDALRRAAGNKAKAAKLLGISRQTIYRKLRALAIDLPTEQP